MKLYGKDILMQDKISVRTIFYFMSEKGRPLGGNFFPMRNVFQLTIMSIMCIYCMDDIKFANGMY